MNLEQVVSELGLEEAAEVLREEWAAAQEAMPNDELFFLQPEFVAAGCTAIFLPEEVAEAAVDVSQRVAAHEPLRALAWYCHYWLYRSSAHAQTWGGNANLRNWPSIEALARTLHEDAGMLYFLVLLSGWPQLKEFYESRSVPHDIARDTLADVELFLDEHYQQYHAWGLRAQRVRLLNMYFLGQIFRLGRLLFAPDNLGKKLHAFRHRGSGQVIALSESDVRYLADGQMDGEERLGEKAGAWTAQLLVTEEEITGNPIMPSGYALRQKLPLPRMEWTQVLAPGDPILSFHIPGGTPLTFELCGQALRAATEFFPQHFPEHPFVAFHCSSWVFDAQLQDMLPPTSNMVRLQRECYLLPNIASDFHGIKGAFGHIPQDPTTAPRDTSLQREMLDRLAEGQLHSRAGAGFILADDLNWGSQVYLRQEQSLREMLER